VKKNPKESSGIVTAWKKFNGTIGDVMTGYVMSYDMKKKQGYISTKLGGILFKISELDLNENSNENMKDWV